jgi:hypothetical protein
MCEVFYLILQKMRRCQRGAVVPEMWPISTNADFSGKINCFRNFGRTFALNQLLQVLSGGDQALM